MKDQAEKKLRDMIHGGPISETDESTNLHLTREQFMERMHREQDGQALLDLMESGEWRICERMGLCEGYVDDGISYIDVPGWANLVAHLRIVNSV